MSDSPKIKQAMSMKMRLIIISTGVSVLVAGVSFYSYHKAHVIKAGKNQTEISHVSNMESVPGIGNASDNYINTQNRQNIANANKNLINQQNQQQNNKFEFKWHTPQYSNFM